MLVGQVNGACYILNRVYLQSGTSQIPYEIWHGNKPIVKYFSVFGSKCYILTDREYLGKFDANHFPWSLHTPELILLHLWTKGSSMCRTLAENKSNNESSNPLNLACKSQVVSFVFHPPKSIKFQHTIAPFVDNEPVPIFLPLLSQR